MGFALALGAVVLLALALRLPGLTDKPLHYDEGVNGWLTLQLFESGEYRYQPENYHGPFPYYANLLFFWLFGPGEGALRLSGVLVGSCLPLLLLPARRFLGSTGVIVAGLMLAVGPGFVYFSRTAIHEIHLVFFTALWAVTLARFAADPGPRWAVWAAVAAAGCFVNKESAVINAACLAVGGLLAWLLGRRETDEDAAVDADLFAGRTRGEAAVAWTTGCARGWILSGSVFALLLVLFYSSFFSHLDGVADLVRGYRAWFDYGTSGRNQGRPFSYFWGVMGSTEGLLQWIVVPAGSWALFSAHRTGIAVVGWAGAAFLIHSWLPYKTPWLVLNVDLPVCVLVGWAARQLWLTFRDASYHAVERGAALVFVVACLAPAPGLLLWSIEDNRERYDDPSVPYVYYQTFRGIYELLDELDAVAAARPGADGGGPRVLNVGVEHPLRWYLAVRGWQPERALYLLESPSPAQIAEADVVMIDHAHLREVSALLEKDPGSWHMEIHLYRPGVYAVVWYRKELWDAYEAAQGA